MDKITIEKLDELLNDLRLDANEDIGKQRYLLVEIVAAYQDLVVCGKCNEKELGR